MSQPLPYVRADFGPTLLYVDITNACPIGCDFCMYLPVQGNQHLALDATRTATLKRLLKGTPRLSISGEGEPLTQMARVLAVAALAGPTQVVEIITSGGIPWRKLAGFLEEFEALAHLRGFTPRIRLSIDHWHFAKVRHHNYVPLIQRAVERHGHAGTTQLAFRSVTTERAWVTSALSAQLAAADIAHRWSRHHELTEHLLAGDVCIPIAFKNLVQPAQTGTPDELPLEEYLRALERVHGRPFTFGNLDSVERLAGPDVTVKHDGQVLLYGLEPEPVWSLDDSSLDREKIVDAILGNPVLRAFYSRPLLELLSWLRREPTLSRHIDSVNNPYWVLKSLREEHGEAFSHTLSEFFAREVP